MSHAIVVIVIIAATWIALSPVLENDFVNWGDVQDITSNERYRGFGPGKLWWMFTTFQMGHWQPLSWLTFALDYEIAGMDPQQYHLSSLIYHVIASVVVYCLILALLRAAWGETFAVKHWLIMASAGGSAAVCGTPPARGAGGVVDGAPRAIVDHLLFRRRLMLSIIRAAAGRRRSVGTK